MPADTDVEVLRRQGRIVVASASPAGLRTAETLRDQGFTGSLTMIGDEPYEPYDRPPLSKQARPEDTELPRRRDIDAEWCLGLAAEGQDRDAKRIRLAKGDTVRYDRLLITTGTGARPVAGPPGQCGRTGRDHRPHHLLRKSRSPSAPVAAEVLVLPVRCRHQVGGCSLGWGDDVFVAQGALDEERFVAVYGFCGRVIDTESFDGAKWLGCYERQIAAGARFPPECRTGDRHTETLQPVDPAFPDPHLPTHGPTVTLTGHPPSEGRVEFVPSHA